MNKNLKNLIVRIMSCFILDKTKRKAFRKEYLIDKNFEEIYIEGKNNKIIIVENGKEKLLKNGDILRGGLIYTYPVITIP